MRIAFVVGSFPELSETFVLDQITGLLDLGHQVAIFGRAPDSQVTTHAVVDEYGLLARTRHWSRGLRTPLDTLVRTRRLLARQPARVARVLLRCLGMTRHGSLIGAGRLWACASMMLEESEPFDVIVAHFGANGLLAQQLRDVGALEAPLATVFHGHDLSRQLQQHGAALYQPLFARGELMLPVSQYFQRRLLALGCAAERVQVQHMGVDLARFAFRERVRHGDEPVRLISVCRLVEKKGLAFGLRAAAELLHASCVPFVWDILGDGPLRGELTRLTEQLGLAAQVRFHGARTRTEVQAALASAHLFFAPSVTAQSGDQEGVPVAIMEAAASGLPVLTTRHAGIPELVHDGETGYLADEWNVAELADKLRTLLRDSDSWAAMGRAGRARVAEQFELCRLNEALQQRLAVLAARATGSRSG